jgi:hypothetical protein
MEGTFAATSHPLSVRHNALTLFRRVRAGHRPSGQPDVFLLAAPGSGSSWLAALIAQQPGFRYIDEPLGAGTAVPALSSGSAAERALTSSEALERYFRDLCKSPVPKVGPTPRHPLFRPATHRTVLRIAHRSEEVVGRLTDGVGERLGGRSLLLVRHPIATSIARQSPLELGALLARHSVYLTEAQRREGRRVAQRGSRLERGVLAWCLHHLRALGQRSLRQAVLSYEQLVLEPERSALFLADHLALPDGVRLLVRLGRGRRRPRSSVEQLDGWRDRVSASQERQLMGLLELFQLDAYRAGDPLPAPELWLAAPHPAQPLPRHRPRTVGWADSRFHQRTTYA